MEYIITEVWHNVFPSIENEMVGGSRDAIVHVVSLCFDSEFFMLSNTWSLGR